VAELIARLGLPCRVLREYFLEHTAEEPYDAIVDSGWGPATSFVRTHIWPGNSKALQLSSYVAEVARSPLELRYVRNDRRNYLLTTRHWAQRLDRHREQIVARWGEETYRRFRLYLWGCVHFFGTGDVTAYRMLLELPTDTQDRWAHRARGAVIARG
jgi:cyclopropane-fatty-acyl-phospholipid synthase